jgi:hypothetical protein
MYLTNSTALPAGNVLIVGAGGNFTFDPNVSFAPASGNSPVSPHSLAAVPEPGTLALLAAAALAAGLVVRARRQNF